MDEDQQEPEEYVDHVSEIQGVLANMDETALCTGFVAIVEWIEEDGTPTLSMIHSPMQPWHLQGMLQHAVRYNDMPVMVFAPGGDDEDDSWDQYED